MLGNDGPPSFQVFRRHAPVEAKALATAGGDPGLPLHVEAGGYLDGLAVVETEGGARQRPGALLALRLDASMGRWLRGHVELRGAAGGPFEGAHPGIYDLVHTFQNHSPSLELNELYTEARWARAELRLGIQRVAWGKLDGIPPTDVLNPRDYHDPFVQEFEEAKIGVPAAQGSWYPPDLPALAMSQLRLSLTYGPIAVPSRLPLLQERWFPSSALPGARIRIPKGRAERAIEDNSDFDAMLAHDLVVPVNLRTLNHRPTRVLDHGGIFFRAGGTWRDLDWDVMHYSGPETGPNADLRSKLVLDSVCCIEEGVIRGARLRSAITLRQAYDTMHMTGADVATGVAGATLRAEAAVFRHRPYLRPAADLLAPGGLRFGATVDRLGAKLAEKAASGRPLTPTRVALPGQDLFPTRDSVEWGVGIDYLVYGFVPLLQLNQVVFLDSGSRLLINIRGAFPKASRDSQQVR